MGDAGTSTKSSTTATTLHGDHTYTIKGYRLLRSSCGENPVASDRFIVGGHEWVLLFYPGGSRSPHGQPVGDQQPGNVGQGGLIGLGHGVVDAMDPVDPKKKKRKVQHLRAKDLKENMYTSLHVALVGEGPSPQGVISTSYGKMVRTFHKFTIVDQTETRRDWVKPPKMENTTLLKAIEMSCERQDLVPSNCYGFSKFLKRSILEDPANGYLKNDTIVIKYSIDLLVTQGGDLSLSLGNASIGPNLTRVPVPRLGDDLSKLLETGTGADVQLVVDGQEFNVHKIILEARSPIFCAMLKSSMKEGSEGVVQIHNIRAPIFHAMLQYVYTDMVQELNQGDDCMDFAFAGNLLEAAERYKLFRLRKMCERRLERRQRLDAETAAATLAEQYDNMEI